MWLDKEVECHFGNEEAGPGETESLRRRVAELEVALRETRAVLGRCVLTTVAASYIVQKLGREHAALVKGVGLSPNIDPLLQQLDKQLQALISSFEESIRGG